MAGKRRLNKIAKLTEGSRVDPGSARKVCGGGPESDDMFKPPEPRRNRALTRPTRRDGQEPESADVREQQNVRLGKVAADLVALRRGDRHVSDLNPRKLHFSTDDRELTRAVVECDVGK